MRPLFKSFATIAMGVLLVAGSGARSAFAVEILDDPAHFGDLSAAAMQTSNALCWELHRYHQQQPEYAVLYRDAKEIWNQAGALNNALQMGPVETAIANQQVARMSELLANIEKGMSKWGDGVRPAPPAQVVERRNMVVTPGVGVNVPFFGGFRIGTPRVAVAEDVVVSAPTNQRAIHPNGHGSRRSLERQLSLLKIAVANLTEDLGVPAVAPPPSPVQGPTPVDNPNGPPSPTGAPTPVGGPTPVRAPTPVSEPGAALPKASPVVPQPALPSSTSPQDEGRVIKVVPSTAKKTIEPPAVNK